MKTNTPDFLSVPQVAAKLGIDPTTVNRYIHQGIFQAIRIGRVWRIPVEEYERFIRQGGVDLRKKGQRNEQKE